MPSIQVGCSGFPVAQARYFSTFRAVEVASSFYQPPRPATAERWRAGAPKGFEFTVKAWQLITHLAGSPGYRHLSEDLLPSQRQACGHFQNTAEVRRAWGRTRELAKALKARIILFQTPAAFHAGAGMIRNLYDFFRSVPRDEFLCVWEPRGDSWKPALVREICADLGLVHGTDPLRAPPAYGRIQYFRLHGTYRDRHVQSRHGYSEAELTRLAACCAAKPTYAFFDNSEMFEDAQRFAGLVGAEG